MKAILLWAHIQLSLLLREHTLIWGEKNNTIMPQSYYKWRISFLRPNKQSRDQLDLQFSNMYMSNQLFCVNFNFKNYPIWNGCITSGLDHNTLQKSEDKFSK